MSALYETITQTTYCPDTQSITQLYPQPGYMCFYCILTVLAVAAKKNSQQPLFGYHPPGIAHQQFEKQPFALGQVDNLAIYLELVTGQVDMDSLGAGYVIR
jgi:hypothetical protein